MLVSRESYTTRVKLKPLNKKKYPQSLINKAYSLYLRDFFEHGFKGNTFTLYGFEHQLFNRDLFIHQAIIEKRNRKINKIINGNR